MQATAERTHIRWMIRRDMAEVQEIENLCFEFPWTEEVFVGCLRQRNAIGMVAERGDHVVGYMIYELHKTRLDVLNFAVQPRWHRTGVGRSMVDKLKQKTGVQHRQWITCDVREHNLDAQLFFKAMGFRCTNTIRGAYEDTDEDAYRMQWGRCYEDDEH